MTRLAELDGLGGNLMVGALSLQTARAASGLSNFRRFATCSDMALILRLNVDAALALSVLSKMICLRPYMGIANASFLGWRSSEGIVVALLQL